MVITTFSDKKENSGEVFLSQCLFAFADHIHADLKQPPPPTTSTAGGEKGHYHP